MSSTRRTSIRTQIFVLVLGVAAPLLALLGYLLYLETRSAIDRAGEATARLANRTAAETERYFDGNRSWMERVAQRPGIRALDPAHCDPLIKDLQTLSPVLIAIYLGNLEGEVICAGLPVPAATTMAGREWFERAVRERRFVVGEATIGRVSGRWISVQTQPIVDNAGAVIGTLNASIDLETYDPVTSGAFLPPATALIIVDNKGTIVAARYPGAGKWVGKKALEAGLPPEVLDKGGLPAFAKGPDGVERLFAAASIANSGWHAMAGIPLETAFQDLKRNAALVGLLTLATLALCIGLGIYSGRKLEAPIRRIASVAVQVSQGKFDARAEVSGPAEIADVATEINCMLARIESFTGQVQALSRRLAEAQETERKGLARELHDQVGQKLATINVNLSIVRAQLDPGVAAKVADRLDDSLALVIDTTERVRNVMAELRPPVLDDYGLAAALRWYGSQCSQRNEIAVEVHGVEPSPRLAPQIETAFFRIAQETLNNVVKHARAKRIDITLEQTPVAVTLTFADDGVGFDSAAVGRKDTLPHWGLLIMRERAEGVGAAFTVDSAPGCGTRVMVTMRTPMP